MSSQASVPRTSAGNALVAEQFQPAYEDNAIGVAKVEHRYSYAHLTATGTVKASAGFLHSLVMNKIVATGTLTIADGGSTIAVIDIGAALATNAPIGVLYDVAFSTNLVLTMVGAMDVTVSFR